MYLVKYWLLLAFVVPLIVVGIVVVRRTKWPLAIGVTAFLLVTGVGITLWIREAQAWNTAKSLNTVEAWEVYVKAYPDERVDAWDRYRESATTRARKEDRLASYFYLVKNFSDVDAQFQMKQKLETSVAEMRQRWAVEEKKAEFTPSKGPHAIVLFNHAWKIHPWHDRLPLEWQPSSEENIRMIVQLAEEKTLLSVHEFVDGPPIKRFQHDLKAIVYEPKTGRVLAKKTFQNIPREVKKVEIKSITELGEPVRWEECEKWIHPAVLDGKFSN